MIAVELNNPPPLLDRVPPDDEFDGNVLDAARWTTGTAGAATVAQDGRLILSTSSQEPLSAAQVASTWQFVGDFDVQVDFQIGEGWASPAQDHLDGAYLAVTIAGENYRITRLRSSSEDKLFSWSTTGALTAYRDSHTASGGYRLIRAGTELYLLFDIGEGWQELASTTVPPGPAQVNLGSASINASVAFTTYFDHFVINSGRTTFGQ